MQKFLRVLKIAAYPLLALVLFFQALGIVGVKLSYVDELQAATWLIPVWFAAIVISLATLLLYKMGCRSEKWALLPCFVGVIGAALALMVTLTLQAALPLQVAATNISKSGLQGLDAFKLITRHYSLMAVGLIPAVLSVIRYKDLRDTRIREENESYVDRFTPDADPTVETPAPRKKMSKKQRKELREKQESGK